MGTEKRARQKANKAAKLAEQEAAEAKARRSRAIRNVVLFGIGIVVVAVLLSLVGCSSNTDDAKERPSSTTGSATSATGGDEPSDTGSATTTQSGDNATYGTGECPPEEGTDQPVLTFDDAPQRCIDLSATWTATFNTSLGSFTVELDTERTPVTTNNFVVLARSGYFDGTDLFRTEADTGIIQGGSPHTQSNTDEGPGYTIPDEGLPFTSEDYGPGTLAMARTAAPDSGSAQFFLLAGEGGRYLGDTDMLGPSAGTYVVFGRTTDGLDVLTAIAALDDGTGVPSTPVTIESVDIAHS